VFGMFIAHFSIGTSTRCPFYISSLLFDLAPAVAYRTLPCGSVAGKTDFLILSLYPFSYSLEGSVLVS